MTAAGSTPAPPPGPGVWAPFVAPPTDGTTRRRWLAIGLAALAVLLCCVGGVVAMGSLAVLGGKVEQDQARAVVTDYLNALREEKYATAYGLLCADLRQQVSLGEFTATQTDQPKISSFTVQTVAVDSQVTVTVRVEFVNGAATTRKYVTETDSATGESRICGTVD